MVWPLLVCKELSEPQLVGFWQVTVQSTPVLLGSLLTTAVRFVAWPGWTDPAGAG